MNLKIVSKKQKNVNFGVVKSPKSIKSPAATSAISAFSAQSQTSPNFVIPAHLHPNSAAFFQA
jgi:hypothetical protein